MGRHDKLFARLDALEADFVEAAIDEFDRVLAGQASAYLGRKLRRDWDKWIGPAVVDRTADRAVLLESLEEEALKLRKKLRTAEPGQAIAAVDEFVKRITDDGGTSEHHRREFLEDARDRFDELRTAHLGSS